MVSVSSNPRLSDLLLHACVHCTDRTGVASKLLRRWFRCVGVSVVTGTALLTIRQRQSGRREDVVPSAERARGTCVRLDARAGRVTSCFTIRTAGRRTSIVLAELTSLARICLRRRSSRCAVLDPESHWTGLTSAGFVAAGLHAELSKIAIQTRGHLGHLRVVFAKRTTAGTHKHNNTRAKQNE
jgi:hypothetical protein